MHSSPEQVNCLQVHCKDPLATAIDALQSSSVYYDHKPTKHQPNIAEIKAVREIVPCTHFHVGVNGNYSLN